MDFKQEYVQIPALFYTVNGKRFYATRGNGLTGRFRYYRFFEDRIDQRIFPAKGTQRKVRNK